MTTAGLVGLLQLAIALLIAASGPNVPAQLKTQAVTVANQAIAAANAHMAGGQASGVMTPIAPMSTANQATVPVDAVPSIELDVKTTQKNSNDTTCGAYALRLDDGEHAIEFVITGDWDGWKIDAWRPDGTPSAGTGFVTPDTRGGVFMCITDIFPGEHRWMVTTIKCSDKRNGAKCVDSEIVRAVKEGVCVVE